MHMQALQQLWEPARFTYQVNNPSSQASAPNQRLLGGQIASRHARSAAEAEEEEAESSCSDEEGGLEQSLGNSQVVTRGAEARGAVAGGPHARSAYCFCCLLVVASRTRGKKDRIGFQGFVDIITQSSCTITTCCASKDD